MNILCYISLEESQDYFDTGIKVKIVTSIKLIMSLYAAPGHLRFWSESFSCTDDDTYLVPNKQFVPLNYKWKWKDMKFPGCTMQFFMVSFFSLTYFDFSFMPWFAGAFVRSAHVLCFFFCAFRRWSRTNWKKWGRSIIS